MTSKKDELKWKKVEKLKVFWTAWKYKRSCNKKEHPSLQQLSLEFIYLLHKHGSVGNSFYIFLGGSFLWLNINVKDREIPLQWKPESVVEIQDTPLINKGLTGNDN